jgi:hypothetical protein
MVVACAVILCGYLYLFQGEFAQVFWQEMLPEEAQMYGAG